MGLHAWDEAATVLALVFKPNKLPALYGYVNRQLVTSLVFICTTTSCTCDNLSSVWLIHNNNIIEASYRVPCKVKVTLTLITYILGRCRQIKYNN